MSQSRSPSLLQRHFRYTLGLGRWRWSLILVEEKDEPNMDFSDPELSVNEWVRWSANWSKGKLKSEDIHALIKQKDQPWGRLVKFGAANYHYGRLVLAREALAQSRSRQRDDKGSGQKKGDQSNFIEVEMDVPNLSLPNPSSKNMGAEKEDQDIDRDQ